MSRRQSRERAFQVLFQIDLGRIEPDAAFCFVEDNLGGLVAPYAGFARSLVDGTMNNIVAIDQAIEQYTKDWALKRMAYVDRSIIRLAVYEMLYCQDTPDSVAINEAVELGKTFGSDESGRFINGVLGRILDNKEVIMADAVE